MTPAELAHCLVSLRAIAADCAKPDWDDHGAAAIDPAAVEGRRARETDGAQGGRGAEAVVEVQVTPCVVCDGIGIVGDGLCLACERREERRREDAIVFFPEASPAPGTKWPDPEAVGRLVVTEE